MTRTPRSVVLALALLAVAALAAPASATFPYPGGTTGDPYDYTRLHIRDGNCPKSPTSDLPPNFNCKTSFKLSNMAPVPGDFDYDPAVENNPQELWGVRGPGTNKAWEVTTGRPDTVISVLDSGILWSTTQKDMAALVNKFYLNAAELPVPQGDCHAPATHPYDCNADGVFNVQDYASDPRVQDYPDDWNQFLDPADLIRTFSDGVDQDDNGYTDDISGWDFYEHDNNPGDDVEYGHGSGEAGDSAAEVDKHLTQCPNCMLMPLRVGDSFVADINAFAEAAIYATDNGVSVIQEALGTLNHTAFGQAAVDYAYAHGVLVVASEADESAGHHNYPAALNHTMVVNSVTPPQAGGVPYGRPATYLAFNGCTNFGGYTWLSIESVSCSSDATGQSAGMAGLLYSAARNAVDTGVIAPASDGAGRPLSAEEAKQLLRLAADDIDFSTPRCGTSPSGSPGCGPANNFATSIPDSARFITTAGWDQISGWGRLNIDRAVRLVAAGEIPPEADLTGPTWWQPLGTSGHVDVTGSVAAPRTGSYSYLVQFAPGVQPPRFPLSDSWTTVATGSGTEPKTGVLATLDMAAVRAAIDAAPPVYTPADDPTSRDLPEKDAFRIRLVVCTNGPRPTDPAALTSSPNVAIEQRQAFSSADPTRLAGFPRALDADGASSPAFADIDGDGRSELVLGDGNGFVHAFEADGSEAKGFPVHTDPIPLPSKGKNAYTRHAAPGTVYSPILLGSPAVADLDGDGSPEIAVTAADGNLYVFDSKGHPVKGFPVAGNPAYSREPGCQTAIGPNCDDWSAHDVRDPFNTTSWSFTAQPSVGDLDKGTPGLELVAGSNDMHVYAFHADGSPVAGWPVLLGDPAKIASVDPVTHKVTYKPGVGALRGRKVLTTPTLGDVDGDGQLEVAVNVNEQYEETPNWSAVRDPGLRALAEIVGRANLEHPGNTRTYLLYHDGTAHPQHDGSDQTANPDDQAYVKGWPVKVGMLITELLPDVGEGSNGSPVLADVDGDGKLEVATASIAGPVYLFKADGTSFYGSGPDGSIAMNTSEFKNPQATDEQSVPALGGAVFGRLAGKSGPLSVAMGGAGLRRLLDVVLPEQQLGAEDHLGVWNATTGSFDPGFPAAENDLQFFNTPAVADVDGDGRADVLEGSAMYDLRAYGLGGLVPAGFPKFTGGWMVTTPAVGDLNGDGKLDVAAVTREGELYVWSTAAPACQPAEWPKYQHDLWNTGNYTSRAPTGLAMC